MAQSRRGSKRPGGRAEDRRQGGGGHAPLGNGSKGRRGGRFFTETKVWRDPTITSGHPAASVGTAAETAQTAPLASEAVPKRPVRIIAGPRPTTADAKELERQRLLGRVLTAEGRPSITRAVDDYLAGGHELPREQAVWLQVLEHRDEARIALAIETLQNILAEAAVERRAVLESRLRRIEELAEERATRTSAAELRRFLQGGAPPSKGTDVEG
jgi:hypothetical protein